MRSARTKLCGIWSLVSAKSHAIWSSMSTKFGPYLRHREIFEFMCENICEKQVGKYVLNRAVSVPVICASDDVHVSVQRLPYIRMYIRKNVCCIYELYIQNVNTIRISIVRAFAYTKAAQFVCTKCICKTV